MTVTPEVGRQPLEPAGVLGRDHVGRGQLLGEPRRRVGDPADRGRREDEHAGSSRPVMRPSQWSSASLPSRAPVTVSDRDRPRAPDRARVTGPVARRRRARRTLRAGAGPGPAAARGPGRRLGSRDRGRRCWRSSCGCGTSARRGTSRSTRPTTPRTPGRCSTTATSATTSATATSRSSTDARRGIWKDDPSMIVHPEAGQVADRRSARRRSGWTRSAGGSPRPSSAR